MSTPDQRAESPTKSGAAVRVTGALAALSGVLAVVLIVLGVVGLARVSTPNMQEFNAGATVTITNSGASIYARSDTERTAAVCAATKDSTSTTLDRPISAFSIDVSQSEFFEVARTPQSLAAGTYSVTCEGTTSAMYVGPSAPTTSASGLLGPAGLISGIILAVIALVLGIVTVILKKVASAKKTFPANWGDSAVQSQYSSPYASPAPPASMGQQPYSQAPNDEQAPPAPYSQSAGAPAFTPPPPASWQNRQPEGTQANAYGQGRYAPSEDQSHDSAGSDADHKTGSNNGDDNSHNAGDASGDDNTYSPTPPLA